MTWQDAVKIIESLWSSVIEHQLVIYLAGIFGVSGWFAIWFIGKGLDLAWTKEIDPAIKSGAASEDMKNTEDDNLKKYDDAVKQGDLDAIAKSAGDILNGTKSP